MTARSEEYECKSIWKGRGKWQSCGNNGEAKTRGQAGKGRWCEKAGGQVRGGGRLTIRLPRFSITDCISVHEDNAGMSTSPGMGLRCPMIDGYGIENWSYQIVSPVLFASLRAMNTVWLEAISTSGSVSMRERTFKLTTRQQGFWHAEIVATSMHEYGAMLGISLLSLTRAYCAMTMRSSRIVTPPAKGHRLTTRCRDKSWEIIK